MFLLLFCGAMYEAVPAAAAQCEYDLHHASGVAIDLLARAFLCSRCGLYGVYGVERTDLDD